MADLPNDFWSGWIVVLTVTGFTGLAWLVLSVYFLPQQESEQGEQPVWDEDLREGFSPAPLWWFWMILAAMVFSVFYLMMYPGLGSFKGALRWSQGGQVEQSFATYDQEFAGIRADIAAMPLEDLQSDASLMEVAGHIFTRNCAACHGYQAQGQAATFPNLSDSIWQWGGSVEQVEQTIRNGRRAVMIPWQAVLGDTGVANVAEYVLALRSGGTQGLAGQVQYNQFCMACHGADGAGNPLLGAPSLRDDDWLYGGTLEAVSQSISQGRNGEMPAFGQRLDNIQVRLLVTLDK